jgi:hypothetical protein
VIHCTMEDLVALRGGEGSAWSRRHLGECAECQKEFDVLHQRIAQLRALPTLNPPRDRWPVVRAGILTERRKKRLGRARWASLALAASLAGMIAVRGTWHRVPAAVGNTQDLQSLVSRSQQLEETLRQYDPANRVMSAARAGAVADLEDRIAAVDAELGQPASRPRNDMVNLWRQRVQLMEGLVNVHVASATYSGM